MDYSKRFDQIENLLVDLLKSNDRHNELLIGQTEILKGQTGILNKHSDILMGQTTVLELLVKKADRTDETLARIERELTLMRPILEKAIDQDDRLRKLEAAVFKKGA
jgi:hypothetical protein